MLSELGWSRVLLLQGPMGPFFARLRRELQGLGMDVHRINLNAGDALYDLGGQAYRGDLLGWPAFLERFMREHRIEGVLLFGDGRPYHRAAIEVARGLGVGVYVFEEGYLRPDWITLERDGVNGHSSLSRDPASYARVDEKTRASERPTPVGQTFRFGAIHSTLYSLAMTLGFLFYPRYVHHRPLNAWAEAYRWVRGGARKYWFAWKERNVMEALVADNARRFFLAVLQVHCDFQLWHSKFRSVEEFIEHVVASFAANASKDDVLVIKHHPMDRPYRDYSSLIDELRVRYELGSRLVSIHDLHLPTLLRRARGSVMINSTVGLQAIQQGTPVKVLGAAIYDMPGLTHQGTLDEFWRDQGKIDESLLRRFRAHLLRTNQFNGSFYRRLAGVNTPTGVRWLSLLVTLATVFWLSAAQAQSGVADPVCPRGSADCNPCANNVEAQFKAIFSASGRWDLHTYRFAWRSPLPPSNIKPKLAVLRWGRDSGNHVQGFAHTNSERFPFVMSHNNNQHGGVVAFVERDGKAQFMTAIRRISNAHPSGVQVLGRYAVVADAKNVRLFDVEQPHAKSSITITPEKHGFAQAGGGLALAKLYDGSYLLLTSTPGGPRRRPGRPHFVRFFSLTAPLSQPQQAKFLGMWRYRQPRTWARDVRFSENVSLITECKTGNLYAVHTEGQGSLWGDGYFRLSRVELGKKPRLVPVDFYVHDQTQRSCHLRSTATSFVRSDHTIDLYCHERGASMGLGIRPNETFRFQRGHVPKLAAPPID